jgi:hypothetical protein
MREGSMTCCSWVCLACLLLFAVTGRLHAEGIEAAAEAERLIASCHDRGMLSVPQCLNDNLNRKWKYELDYAGKPFAAMGRFKEVRKSLVGNLFAFILVGQYQVACRVTKKYADRLSGIESSRTVLVSGVLESYNLTFNLTRVHHLRLTPYCSIEIAT